MRMKLRKIKNGKIKLVSHDAGTLTIRSWVNIKKFVKIERFC